MNRRQFFIGMTGVVLLAATGPVHAQPAAKVPRIGVLSPANSPPRDPFHQRESFEGGLRELG
jgi:hypothetical protein